MGAVSSATTIPAALDAILAALNASPATEGVQVVDGQPVGSLKPDVIVVGFSPDRPAVEARNATSDLKSRSDREDYDIACLVSSWRGDKDPKPVRDRCSELLDIFSDVLRADRTLGGAVMSAWISAVSLDSVQTTTGPSCTAEVIVSVAAFTRR